MGHAGIFFNIIALIIGALAVFYSYQTHKTYKYLFLRPYMVFLIFFNISILFDLTANYYYTNLAGDSNTSQYPLIIRIISIIGYFFYIAVTYTLIQVTQELQDKRMSSRSKLCFVVGTASVMVIYGIEILFSPQNTLLNRIIIINIFVMTALLILIYLFLILLLIYSKKLQDPNKSKIINAFGIFYVSGYTLLFASNAFPESIRFFSYLGLHLLFNLIPFLWIKQYLQKYWSVPSLIIENMNLNEIYDRHGISQRERDIAGLLMQGKSNKEIADSLYIAPNTVKNHIHSLFQKLQVRSRFQLMNFFLSNQRK
ncbi:MAG: helix-turn-helix transcriptional regulator [Candidatus Aminicenantes bacterium]|nr:helix-turn-helix transcriptional regulator [Candidatus Aminicenantes bacterium]MDH5468352.1 helix-turn-helix transcriptional regulator [Candidatus Aminicenantes bacterium]MDH5706794.1 helix-turn-helix transcriptional regulator [Candidatus Aminicenantes bacterium]